MFTEEQKIRAIELYFKYGKKLAPVVRELGYPSKKNLRRWSRSWETGGGEKESIRHQPRYSDVQNKLPLNIILTTAAAWRLPAELWVIPAVMCSFTDFHHEILTTVVKLAIELYKMTENT